MEVLMARCEFLTLSGSGFQAMAIKLIESGKECPALHELAWDPVISSREAAELFESAALQLGIPKPTRSEAVQILLHYYATQITKEGSSPHDELKRMMNEVYWPEVSNHQSTHYVGDSHDMESFIGAYWSYDDLQDNPDVVGFNGLYGQAAHMAFDEHTRSIAAKWLENQPAPSFNFNSREPL